MSSRRTHKKKLHSRGDPGQEDETWRSDAGVTLPGLEDTWIELERIDWVNLRVGVGRTFQNKTFYFDWRDLEAVEHTMEIAYGRVITVGSTQFFWKKVTNPADKDLPFNDRQFVPIPIIISLPMRTDIGGTFRRDIIYPHAGRENESRETYTKRVYPKLDPNDPNSPPDRDQEPLLVERLVKMRLQTGSGQSFQRWNFYVDSTQVNDGKG